MPKFLIRELQHVHVVRTVEAANEDEAWEKFCEGEGEPHPYRNGEVAGSDLLEITRINEEADA
jgi:hypothetical protein